MKRNKSIPIWVFLFALNGFCLCSGFFIIISECVVSVKEAVQIQTEKNLRTFAYAAKAFFSEHEVELQNQTSNVTLDGLLKKSAGGDKDFRITVVDSSGVVIADSDAPDTIQLENHLKRSEIASALNGNEGKAIRKSTVSNKLVMYYAIPFIYQDSIVAIRLSMPIEAASFISLNESWHIIILGIIVLLIVLASSFAISAYIVKKINILKDASVQYKKGNFDFESLVTSPKEIKQLGVAYYDMAQTIKNNLEKMKKLEQIRTDFVANVSHELKTPVTSIKGFVETLLDGALDDKNTARDFLEIIDTQTIRLNSIIEDLLCLSRLESKNESPLLVKTEVSLLVSILRQICGEFSTSNEANKKGISIVFENKISKSPAADNDLIPSCYVNLDGGLFSQAVSNILDNAVKYCPEKSFVECKLAICLEEKKKILITIEDNGKGIPSEYCERIFERFFRVDKSRSRQTGGTGLGLSIAMHIIKLHNGTIIARQRYDGKQGACFEIELPVIL